MKRCNPLLCLFEHIFQCSLAHFCLALRQMIVDVHYNGAVTGFSRHCKSFSATVNFFDIACATTRWLVLLLLAQLLLKRL